MNAIIVGSGIGGLCAAIALQRIGIAAHVYEQAGAIRELGAGLSLWPNAITALKLLGVEDAIRTMAVEDVDNSGIMTWNGKPLLTMSAQELIQNFGTAPIIVHRADLHAILMQALQPGTLHLGARCTGYTQTTDQVTASFEDGTQQSGAVLISADGLRSSIRQQIAPNNKPRYCGYTAWRGVTTFDHRRVAQWGEFWGVGRRFGIAPLSNNRVYWFCTENASEGETRQINPEDRRAHLLELFKGWTAPISALIAETDVDAILNNDISDIAPLSRWTDGRTTLLGDAAHAMTPNLGQGACQAVEDAVILAQCIQTRADIPEALHVYEQRRIPRTSQIVKISRTIGQIGQWNSKPACAFRNLALRVLPGSVRLNSMKSVLTFDTLKKRNNVTAIEID